MNKLTAISAMALRLMKCLKSYYLKELYLLPPYMNTQATFPLLSGDLSACTERLLCFKNRQTFEKECVRRWRDLRIYLRMIYTYIDTRKPVDRTRGVRWWQVTRTLNDKSELLHEQAQSDNKNQNWGVMEKMDRAIIINVCCCTQSIMSRHRTYKDWHIPAYDIFDSAQCEI